MREDYDADLIREQWESKRKWRCQCGYPDWPGQCPGPSNCPACNYGKEEEEEQE